jgi:hypothetical protein
VIRYLRALLLFARHQCYVADPSWEAEDSRRLAQFMSTVTGKRLAAKLLNQTLVQQASAIAPGGDLSYRCGYATGFKGACVSLQSLALVPNVNETVDTGGPGLDHLSP